MAMNKRKTTTAIVAAVTALALLLGGTFAWTSISQQARNEAIVDINPGGRLHDDFNGTNKDVYVENFGDKTTGVPIFARVRLDQYFEVGQEAGKNKGTAMADRNVEAKIGTDINDVTTWVPYIPGEGDLADTSKVPANTNWRWKLGRTTADGDVPIYLPTFNMNKDSLAADINGTYEGTTEGDIVHYDDYKTYTENQDVSGTEIYDWDSDTKDEPDGYPYDNGGVTEDKNTPIDDADVYQTTNDHRARPLSCSTSTVISMADWIAAGSQPGPYWVYDTDGWAYWAQPIEPGMTTGLLLDSINMSKVPDDNYYYGINVVGQFATAGDIYQFDGMTENAKELFATVSGAEEITISGPDTITVGGTATYSASRYIVGSLAETQPTFTWSVNEIEGVTMDNDELTVGDNVAIGTQITVTATVTDGTATAADGDESTTETTPLSASMTVTVIGEATVTADSGLTMYTFGGTTTETFTASMDDTSTAGTFTWSVTDGDGNQPTDATITVDATDSTKATLTVGANETADKLIVTATFKPTDSTNVYVGTYEVKSSEIKTTDDMEATAYVLMTSNGTDGTYTMNFVRSNDKVVSGSSTYNSNVVAAVYEGFEETKYSLYGLPWIDLQASVSKVKFNNPIKPADTTMWFSQMKNLTSIDGLNNLNVSDASDMSYMFYSCEKLENIDLSIWDVQKVTNVSYMFSYCTALKNVDLSDWNTENVTEMKNMFYGCEVVETINFTGWNTEKVESMENLFSVCYKLKTLNISNWNTGNVTTMDSMFHSSGITTLDLSGWDTGKVETMEGMFAWCQELETLTFGEKWNTVNVSNMSQMFSICQSLSELTLGDKWNTENVTDMSRMFTQCGELTLDCSDWNVGKVTEYKQFNESASGVIAPTWVN